MDAVPKAMNPRRLINLAPLVAVTTCYSDRLNERPALRRGRHGPTMRHMRRTLAAILLLSALGCDSSSGPCSPRHGLYRFRLTPMSSSCPAIPDSVINADNTAAASACRGGKGDAPDMCSTAVDISCPDSSGNVVISRGQIEWSTDGQSGSGTLYLELHGPGGGVTCSGTYSASYTRL